MRWRAIVPIAVVLGAWATAGASALAEPIPGASPTSFIDNFNGPAGSVPSATRWVDYGPRCGAYAGWGRIRCGASERLDGHGHLVIPATASAGSALQTKGRFGFTYGTMSAWIKMPSQAGYWPGFWALNGSQTGKEALTGEIDITEVYTPGRGTHPSAHIWNGSREVWGTSDLRAASATDLTKHFHKYTVEIAPGTLMFYFDDQLVREVTRSSRGVWAWGPDVLRPNFMVLNLAVRRAPDAPHPKPAVMLVDRVEATAWSFG